jgi:peptidoglycan/xylan/chitin deacetylase (PgdA/CDA1 family)
LGEAEIRDELARTAALIGDADRGIKMFRPPYGYHNELVNRVAGELGYQMVFWNVDTLDWDPRFQPHGWAAHGLNQIRGRRHSFVLLHDVHATTIANLAEFTAAIRTMPHVGFPTGRKSIEKQIASVRCPPGAEPPTFMRAKHMARYFLRFVGGASAQAMSRRSGCEPCGKII